MMQIKRAATMGLVVGSCLFAAGVCFDDSLRPMPAAVYTARPRAALCGRPFAALHDRAHHASEAIAARVSRPTPAAETAESAESARLAAGKRLADKFEQLYGQREFFDRDKVYQNVLRSLSQDPWNVSVAQLALEDSGFLHAAFGERQAVGRVFAIKLLKQRAKSDPDVLLAPMRAIVAQLQSGKHGPNGRQWDLDEMLTAYLHAQANVAELQSHPGKVLSSILGADLWLPGAALTEDVRHVMVRSVQGALIDRIGGAEMQATLERVYAWSLAPRT